LNQRLVAFLLVALLAGMLAGALALSAGWGLVAGLLLYSGVGSSALMALALAWPDRPLGLSRRLEEPALA
jgi:hypothetical protein